MDFSELLAGCSLGAEIVPEPEREVAQNETVVGILPDDLRVLYGCLVESAAELEMECLYIHDRTLAIVAKLLSGGRVTLEQNLLAECHMLLHMNHKIITDIFQYGVKKAFPGLVFESNSIDVRRGWKVVIVARPTQKVKKPKMWTKIWAFLKSALDRLADGGFLHT